MTGGHTGAPEQSVSIDAAPADVFAVLTAVEPVFTESSVLTVSAGEEGVTVTDTEAEGVSPSAFGRQLCVTEREEPTSPTIAFNGATESTVEWTLQREDNP